MSANWERTPCKQTDVRPYFGALHPLDAADVSYFEQRFEIPQEEAVAGIQVAREAGRYALPIFGPDASVRGHVLRIPWAGAPRSPVRRIPKADTHKADIGPLQSHYWHTQPDGSNALVVVEDQLSAIKLAAYGYDSVALLGVPDVRYAGYSGSDRVMEIARRAKDGPVIVALDEDATELAFLFVKKWGHAFTSIRVAMLQKDLKDTLACDFEEILGV